MSVAGDAELIDQSVLAVGNGGEPTPGATLALVRSLGLACPASATERRISDDQSNASVVVDDVIVKWLREPDLVDRGSLLVEHLGAVGFEATPALLGRLRDAYGTRAVVHRHLPGATDGWTWCVDAAIAEIEGREATGWAAAAGRLVGRLTVALATPSVVQPVPVNRGIDRDSLIAECAMETAAATRFDGGPDLAAEWARIDLSSAKGGEPLQGMLLHGDLHVGQLLRWDGGLAVVDFDGDPQRADEAAVPEAPDVDLAHLLVSIELVGSVAAKRRSTDAGVAAWVRRSREQLLRAYLAELDAAGMAQLHRSELLAALEVRQLARELEYAAAYLPRFSYASVAALRRRVDG